MTTILKVAGELDNMILICGLVEQDGSNFKEESKMLDFSQLLNYRKLKSNVMLTLDAKFVHKTVLVSNVTTALIRW